MDKVFIDGDVGGSLDDNFLGKDFGQAFAFAGLDFAVFATLDVDDKGGWGGDEGLGFAVADLVLELDGFVEAVGVGDRGIFGFWIKI